MKKKLIALVLAGIMVMGSAMTVFAEEASGLTSGTGTATGLGSATIVGNGTIGAPTIKVTISKSGDGILVNPYRLAQIGEKVITDENGVIPTFVGNDITLVNESNCAIGVVLTGKVEAAPAVKLATTAAAAESAKVKTVYVGASVIATDAGAPYTITKTVKGESTTITAKAAANTVAYTATGAKLATPIVMAAKDKGATDTVTTTTGDPTTYKASEKITISVTGASGIDPASAWSAEDTVTVTTALDLQLATAPTYFADAV